MYVRKRRAHMARAVGKPLFRITFNTCVEVSPNRKELSLSFIQCPLFSSTTVDNFDLNTSRCARLGVNYFFYLHEKHVGVGRIWKLCL